MLIEDELELCAGSAADYRALREHHYRAARPATMTRVLALRLNRSSVAGRFLRRREEPQTVAVLVESLPSLGCRLREEATGGRYAAVRGMSQRARALNAEIRCISRVIVHPQWRGLGLAVRLVKAALATATTAATEAIAAMGSVHPFFERAGMTAYRAAGREQDARLIAALHRAGLNELDVAVVDRFAERLASLDAPSRGLVQRELKRWFAKTMCRPSNELREQFVAARQWLISDPVYFLHVNANHGRQSHGTCRDSAVATAGASVEQQRDAGGVAGEVGAAHEADGELSAGGGAGDGARRRKRCL